MQTKVTLTEVEAAQYLGVSRSTLRQARMDGRRKNRISSPTFIRLGRAIRYLKEDLDTFLEKHRVDLARGEGF